MTGVNLELVKQYDRNLSLPLPSQRIQFPVVTKAEYCPEQNKTFNHKTNHQ